MLKLLGVSQEKIDKYEDSVDEPTDFVVFPDCWNAVQIFSAGLPALIVNGYIPGAEHEANMRMHGIVKQEDQLLTLTGISYVTQGYLQVSSKDKPPPKSPRHR